MIATYRGIVEHGQVRLTDNVQLPEHAVVYVLLPEQTVISTAHVATPRLGNREDASDFTLEVTQESPGDPV